jgi:hypothetical protein
MASVSNNESLLELIHNPAEWESGFPAAVAQQLRCEWAEEHFLSTLGGDEPEWRDAWMKYAVRAPLPIGKRSIQAAPRLVLPAMLYEETSDFGDRLAVLPGDEILYTTVALETGGSFVRAYFLARLNNQTQVGMATRYEWKPGGTSFSIAGYPTERSVQKFIKQAERWWRSWSGEPQPAGGRPTSKLTHKVAVRAWKQLYPRSVEYDHALGKEILVQKPTREEFVRRLNEVGVRCSETTFYDRQREWKAAGLTMPWE